MSWQANEAVRLASKARGARRSVLYCAATFADESGNHSRPSIDTLEAGAGVSRHTVVEALREAVERGEIIRTGVHPSGTNIYSFAPLVDLAEPLFSKKSSAASALTIVQPVHSESAFPAGDSAATAPEPPVEPPLPSVSRPLPAGEPSLSDLVDDVFNYWSSE